MLEEILSAVLASTASAGIVAFLSKSLLSQWLSKDLEVYKARLQRETNAELERIKAEVTRVNLEHQVRFTRLHEHRARVISGIFARLGRLHSTLLVWLQALTSGSADDLMPRYNDVVERCREFIDFYHPHAIWLDSASCESIDHVLVLLDAPINALIVSVQKGTSDSTALINAIQGLTTELPRIRHHLDEHFRIILGMTQAEVGALANSITEPRENT